MDFGIRCNGDDDGDDDDGDDDDGDGDGDGRDARPCVSTTFVPTFVPSLPVLLSIIIMACK